MTDSSDPEFRDEISRVVKRHDPDPGELRALASDLEDLADRYEEVERTL